MTLRPISITFDQNYSNKIRVIQEASIGPISHSQIVEDLVDEGYANALKTLYVDGKISWDTYRFGIGNLPEHLRSRIAS